MFALQDERPTSNIERLTSNKEVTSLHNPSQHTEKPGQGYDQHERVQGIGKPVFEPSILIHDATPYPGSDEGSRDAGIRHRRV